jgi:hypothetical protein
MGAALLSVVLAVSLALCARAQIAQSTAYASGLGPGNVCKVQENFMPNSHYEWRCFSQSYTDSGGCPQGCTMSVHANGDGSSLYHCSCPVTSSEECQEKLSRPAVDIKCVETLAYDHLNCDTTRDDSNRLATKCCTDGQSKCPGPGNVCKVQENFMPDSHYEWRCTSQSYTDSGGCPTGPCRKSVHANGDGSSLYHCSCPVASSEECQEKLGRPAEQIKCVETLAYDHLNCDTTRGDINRLATKCCTGGQSKCPGPGNVCKVQENFMPDILYEWRCQSYTDSGGCPQGCNQSVHTDGDGSFVYHCSCPVASSEECQEKLGRPAEHIKCVETLAYDHLNCDTTRGDINWLATKCCTGGKSRCGDALCSTCASETAGTPGISEACYAEAMALVQAGKFPVSQTCFNTWGRERLCCFLVLFLSGGVG